jgi:hypothetical protein
VNNLSIPEAYYGKNSCPNAQIIELPKVAVQNPLDKWILSELHTLIQQVSE